MRKVADAEALASELGDFFSPLVFDVTDTKAIASAAAEVRARTKGRKLLALINNAGTPLCRGSAGSDARAVACKHANVTWKICWAAGLACEVVRRGCMSDAHAPIIAANMRARPAGAQACTWA